MKAGVLLVRTIYIFIGLAIKIKTTLTSKSKMAIKIPQIYVFGGYFVIFFISVVLFDSIVSDSGKPCAYFGM